MNNFDYNKKVYIFVNINLYILIIQSKHISKTSRIRDILMLGSITQK